MASKKEFFVLALTLLVVLSALFLVGYKWLKKQENFLAEIEKEKISESVEQTPSGELEIDFINVSQGESILIQTAEGKNILIDGGKDNTVSDYLKRRKVSSIDKMIVTYPAENRILGLLDLFDQIEVKEILLNGDKCDRDYCQRFFQKIKEKNIPVSYPEAKDEYFWAAGLKVIVLNPNKAIGSYKSDAPLRNNSLVFLLEYGEIKIYLAGETEKFIEDSFLHDFILSPIEISKVSNIRTKGSAKEKTTSDLLLDILKPENAIIFVGEGKYELPASDILSRLNKYKTKIYRTDQNGTIVLKTDGQNYHIETER